MEMCDKQILMLLSVPNTKNNSKILIITKLYV